MATLALVPFLGWSSGQGHIDCCLYVDLTVLLFRTFFVCVWFEIHWPLALDLYPPKSFRSIQLPKTRKDQITVVFDQYITIYQDSESLNCSGAALTSIVPSFKVLTVYSPKYWPKGHQEITNNSPTIVPGVEPVPILELGPGLPPAEEIVVPGVFLVERPEKFFV